MAWKPAQWLSRDKAKATAAEDATTEEDTDEDEVLEIEDDEDDETPPATTPPDPAATPDPSAVAAENDRLRAENVRLSAQLGEKTLDAARGDATKAAMRAFGQGTPEAKDAKKLVAACETPGEATRLAASFDLALTLTPLGKTAGTRQTARQPLTAGADPDADVKARAKAAAARTRPTASKAGDKA